MWPLTVPLRASPTVELTAGGGTDRWLHYDYDSKSTGGGANPSVLATFQDNIARVDLYKDDFSGVNDDRVCTIRHDGLLTLSSEL